MSQEPESPVPSKEPEDEDVGEKEDTEDDSISEEATQNPPDPSRLHETQHPSLDAVPKILGDEVEESKAVFDEAPIDWFEPLEDEEFDCISKNGVEEESVAGESERSESVYGSEKADKKVFRRIPRRRRLQADEGWVDWPILGFGWKRKEVVRRSGSSMGQKDVYYMGPCGDRFRSRVELVSMMNGTLDLTTFDYKTGQFCDKVPPLRARTKKRIVRERSSSESSWMERDEGADTPDSFLRLTPSLGTKNHCSQNAHGQDSNCDPPAENKIKLPLYSSSSRRIPVPSINGEIGSEDKTLVCAKCGVSFTGTWYDKQRKRPCCPMCWASSKRKEHPMIRFRKWIPCGQCVGCHNTVNCDQCANCKHRKLSPDSRKRLCRKRKCMCPVRKGSGGGSFVQQMSYDSPDTVTDGMSEKAEAADLQYPTFKSSDTENFSLSLDMDEEDDLSTDEDEDEDCHKRRKRRSCGECKACLCRKDCGTCDFCIDKPKFGGSNKKRQKCRLRQCQRQAMRHLLPFQMGQGDCGQDSTVLPGRPRPHYTYSRKSAFKRNKGAASGVCGNPSDREDDDGSLKVISWRAEPAGGSKPATETSTRRKQSLKERVKDLDCGRWNGLAEREGRVSNHSSELEQLSRWEAEQPHPASDGPTQQDEDEKEELPKITEAFSLAGSPAEILAKIPAEIPAENPTETPVETPLVIPAEIPVESPAESPAGSGGDWDSQLMRLLQSLRATVLPILWYAIMVQGPQLQLIQCSKRSTMTDTIVTIDPGFSYKISVQKQPLLPTHPLYDQYPGRLASAGQVVDLLLALEKYVVCHGLAPRQSCYHREAVILERASTCDFLVKRKESICHHCRALRGF